MVRISILPLVSESFFPKTNTMDQLSVSTNIFRIIQFKGLRKLVDSVILNLRS
jgi:hypothetical protein